MLSKDKYSVDLMAGYLVKMSADLLELLTVGLMAVLWDISMVD
jgi:hypothetical protein